MQQNIIDIIKQARCLIDILLNISPKKNTTASQSNTGINAFNFIGKSFINKTAGKKRFLFVQIFSAGEKLPFIFKSTTIISPFLLDTACHHFEQYQ